MSPVKALYGLPSFIGEMNMAQRNGLMNFFCAACGIFLELQYDAEVACPAFTAIQTKSVVRDVACF